MDASANNSMKPISKEAENQITVEKSKSNKRERQVHNHTASHNGLQNRGVNQKDSLGIKGNGEKRGIIKELFGEIFQNNKGEESTGDTINKEGEKLNEEGESNETDMEQLEEEIVQ